LPITGILSGPRNPERAIPDAAPAALVHRLTCKNPVDEAGSRHPV